MPTSRPAVRSPRSTASGTFGGIYEGTVEKYLDLYIGSRSFSNLKSPTQYVSRAQLDSASASFKAGFVGAATGKVNGPWDVPDTVGIWWERIAANYGVARNADPALAESIVDSLTGWYATLSTDQQYVFASFMFKLRNEFLRNADLAIAVREKLKLPPGMHSPEP